MWIFWPFQNVTDEDVNMCILEQKFSSVMQYSAVSLETDWVSGLLWSILLLYKLFLTSVQKA